MLFSTNDYEQLRLAQMALMDNGDSALAFFLQETIKKADKTASITEKLAFEAGFFAGVNDGGAPFNVDRAFTLYLSGKDDGK